MNSYTPPPMPNAAPVYPIEVNPPPRTKSGLIALRDWVEGYFKAHAVPATVAQVGLKYRSFQLNQTYPGGGQRVVFIPGEFDGNTAPKPRDYGTLSRETRNSTSVINPREIAQWTRTFTLSIWAASPPGTTGDEEAAIIAVDLLLEQTVRACNSLAVNGYSASAAIRWGDVTINAPPVEGGFGAELLVGATLLSPLFDLTLETTQAGPIVPRGTFT